MPADRKMEESYYRNCKGYKHRTVTIHPLAHLIIREVQRLQIDAHIEDATGTFNSALNALVIAYFYQHIAHEDDPPSLVSDKVNA